jgi:uncharacterized protein YggU (UPF0235/DUF167 family)
MDHRWNLVVRGASDKRLGNKRPGVLRFSVKLTPKGGRNVIEGWRTDASGKRVLKARVAAVPEDGKANAALVALIAEALDVGTSKVRIVAGGSSRLKIVEVEGAGTLGAAWLSQPGSEG